MSKIANNPIPIWRDRLPTYLAKVILYEYWKWPWFYIPLLPYYIFTALRIRSFTYFTAANPGIEDGGFFGEKKTDIFKLIDPKWLPNQCFISQQNTIETSLNIIKTTQLAFPLIIKPNVGERGNGITKVETQDELINILSSQPGDYIIQEFIDYPIELGVFYSRLPNESRGIVSSIVRKNFLHVTGNGTNSVREILNNSTRARFQLNRLMKDKPTLLSYIPKQMEYVLVEPIGNHCRGTMFIDANELIDQSIHALFDAISIPIQGFYIGRFDIKVRSIEDFKKGATIKIMELNGVSAEPGHIYDPRASIISAYKDTLWHWHRTFKIAKINIKNGQQPVPFIRLLKSIKSHFN